MVSYLKKEDGSRCGGTYDWGLALAAVRAANATSSDDLNSTAKEAIAANLSLSVGADVGVTTSATTTAATASNDISGSSNGGSGHGDDSDDGGALHVDGVEKGRLLVLVLVLESWVKKMT